MRLVATRPAHSAALSLLAALVCLTAGCDDHGGGAPAVAPADAAADAPALPDAASDAVPAMGDATTPVEDVGPSDGVYPADVVEEATPDGAEPPDGASPEVTADVASDAPVAPALAPAVAAALQATLDEYVAFTGDPGVSLAVRRADGASWAGATGVESVQQGVSMSPATRFRVGSGTKPFVATIVMQLVEEGAVGLDDAITDYVDGYPQWSAITVRQLLGMRAGLPDFLTDEIFMGALIVDPGAPLTPDDLLGFVADQPLTYEPGTGCAYSNTNYVLLGMLVEAVTATPVEQQIIARMATPLGLTDTFLDVAGAPIDHLAHGYMDSDVVAYIFGVPLEILALVPEESFLEGRILDVSYLFHPSFSWAAGALVSTPTDMARFAEALGGGELVTEATLATMNETTSCHLMGGLVSYGLGFMETATPWGMGYGHGGLNFGYESSTLTFPGLGLTLSHMHDYLPEQAVPLRHEVLGALVDGPGDPAAMPGPCLPPEGLFDRDEGPYAELRFKGPVNAANAVVPEGGLSHVRRWEAGESTPLAGLGSSAKLRLDAQGGLRVEITSLAPTNGDGEDGAQIRQATLSVDSKAFGQLAADGSFTLSMAQLAAAIVTIADVTLDATTGLPTKLCFIAVNDFARPSRLQVCRPESFQPAAGQTLAMYGSLALDTDPATVEGMLQLLGMPRCLCSNAGTWGACP